MIEPRVGKDPINVVQKKLLLPLAHDSREVELESETLNMNMLQHDLQHEVRTRLKNIDKTKGTDQSNKLPTRSCHEYDSL